MSAPDNGSMGLLITLYRHKRENLGILMEGIVEEYKSYVN